MNVYQLRLLAIVFVCLAYWGFSYGSKLLLKGVIESRSKQSRYDRNSWQYEGWGGHSGFGSQRFSEVGR